MCRSNTQSSYLLLELILGTLALYPYYAHQRVTGNILVQGNPVAYSANLLEGFLAGTRRNNIMSIVQELIWS